MPGLKSLEGGPSVEFYHPTSSSPLSLCCKIKKTIMKLSASQTSCAFRVSPDGRASVSIFAPAEPDPPLDTLALIIEGSTSLNQAESLESTRLKDAQRTPVTSPIVGHHHFEKKSSNTKNFSTVFHKQTVTSALRNLGTYRTRDVEAPPKSVRMAMDGMLTDSVTFEGDWDLFPDTSAPIGPYLVDPETPGRALFREFTQATPSPTRTARKLRSVHHSRTLSAFFADLDVPALTLEKLASPTENLFADKPVGFLPDMIPTSSFALNTPAKPAPPHFQPGMSAIVSPLCSPTPLKPTRKGATINPAELLGSLEAILSPENLHCVSSKWLIELDRLVTEGKRTLTATIAEKHNTISINNELKPRATTPTVEILLEPSNSSRPPSVSPLQFPIPKLIPALQFPAEEVPRTPHLHSRYLDCKPFSSRDRRSASTPPAACQTANSIAPHAPLALAPRMFISQPPSLSGNHKPEDFIKSDGIHPLGVLTDPTQAPIDFGLLEPGEPRSQLGDMEFDDENMSGYNTPIPKTPTEDNQFLKPWTHNHFGTQRLKERRPMRSHRKSLKNGKETTPTPTSPSWTASLAVSEPKRAFNVPRVTIYADANEPGPPPKKKKLGRPKGSKTKRQAGDLPM